MITKDDLLVVGRENHGSVLFPDYSEIKRRLSVFKSDGRIGNGECEVGSGINGENALLRPLETFVIGISDFEGEVKESMGAEGEE